MTRLEVLCKLNNQQGGTIFQFNTEYGVNFLALTDSQFTEWVLREGLINVLNGLYALRDCAKDLNGPDAGVVEQRLINIGKFALGMKNKWD
jgi:hypothetical protein